MNLYMVSQYFENEQEGTEEIKTLVKFPLDATQEEITKTILSVFGEASWKPFTDSVAEWKGAVIEKWDIENKVIRIFSPRI